jgi:hypothetical protein
MRFSVLAISFALAFSLPAEAHDVVAQCSLMIEGAEVWNGKCCVSADASPGSMTADLHAESWQACLYKKKHPENENLPTYKQKCIGPWINISQESETDAKGNNYSAYWSLEGACHGSENFSAKRNGNVYQGDKFIFEWHEAQ